MEETREKAIDNESLPPEQEAGSDVPTKTAVTENVHEGPEAAGDTPMGNVTAEGAHAEAEAVNEAPAETAGTENVHEGPETAEDVPVETMDNYKEELERSLRKIHVGDIITGKVISVNDDAVLVDLNSYADGLIRKGDLSADPDFNAELEINPGDEITAKVTALNDGDGNLLLSRKEAEAALAWDKLKKMMEERTVVKVKISGVVNAGAVAYLEGIRGFIPVSRITDGYVEDTNEWLGKSIDVTVITVDEEKKRLVLSGREAAREKKREEKNSRIAKCEVGAIMKGTVETIKPYGAFIELENGLSGLLHISRISSQRIKHPSVVLTEGQEVRVKIISTADNKISLSMKELEETAPEEDGTFDYKEEGRAYTGLAELLKGIKL